MTLEELKDIVDIIEGACEYPNEPVGTLLLALRSNASYRKLVGIIEFSVNGPCAVVVARPLRRGP